MAKAVTRRSRLESARPPEKVRAYFSKPHMYSRHILTGRRVWRRRPYRIWRIRDGFASHRAEITRRAAYYFAAPSYFICQAGYTDAAGRRITWALAGIADRSGYPTRMGASPNPLLDSASQRYRDIEMVGIEWPPTNCPLILSKGNRSRTNTGDVSCRYLAKFLFLANG